MSIFRNTKKPLKGKILSKLLSKLLSKGILSVLAVCLYAGNSWSATEGKEEAPGSTPRVPVMSATRMEDTDESVQDMVQKLFPIGESIVCGKVSHKGSFVVDTRSIDRDMEILDAAQARTTVDFRALGFSEIAHKWSVRVGTSWRYSREIDIWYLAGADELIDAFKQCVRFPLSADGTGYTIDDKVIEILLQGK